MPDVIPEFPCTRYTDEDYRKIAPKNKREAPPEHKLTLHDKRRISQKNLLRRLQLV